MANKKWSGIQSISNYSDWSLQRGERYYAINVTHKTLPAGIYEVRTDNEDNPYVREIRFPTDDLMIFPNTPVDYVLKQIDKFWANEEVFERLGLVYKRGILFYGPAGCGKTSIIRILINRIIERNGIVFSTDDVSDLQDFLLQFRQIEPERHIMIILEDVEKFMEDDDEASQILSFLDGEKQIGNIITIATTNKPDVLEDRLIKRPGRFDIIVGLNPPNRATREAYLQKFFKDYVSIGEFEKIVNESEGLGMAHLREIAVSVLCFGANPSEVIKRLKSSVKETYKAPKLGQRADTGFVLGFTNEEERNELSLCQ